MSLHKNIFHYPITIHLQQQDHIGSSLWKNNSIAIFLRNQSICSPISVSIGWLCIRSSANLIKKKIPSPLNEHKKVMLTMLNIIVYIMKYVCWHGKYCTYSFVCCGMLFNLSMSHACSPLGSPFFPQYFVALKIRGNNIAMGVTSVFNLLGLLIDFMESNVNSPTTKVDNSQYQMCAPQIDRNIYDINLRPFQKKA